MDDGHINYDDAGFEKEDLSRLIEKTVSDLQQVDKRREEEFKQYEVEGIYSAPLISYQIQRLIL